MNFRSASFALLFAVMPYPLHAQDSFRLNLEECRRIALENNNDIKNSRLDVRSAKARKSEVFANYFPQLSIGGFAFHSLDYQIKMDMTDIFGKNEFGYNMQAMWAEAAPELGLTGTFNFLQYGQHYGAVAIQPVFSGGRIVNGNLYAKLGIRAAELKTVISRRNALEEVDRNYFTVVALTEKQKTLDALGQLIDTLDVITAAALKNGVIVKADRLLLENKKAELLSGKSKLRGGIRLAKMNLLSDIGLKFRMTDLDRYEFPDADAKILPKPQDVYQDEEKAVSQMEESQLLDLQIEARKFDKKLTLGSVLPQIGIGMSYGFTELNGLNKGRWNGSVFAAFSIPITDWAKSSYKMQQDQLAIEKATNDRNHLNDMLVLQLRKLYLDLTNAWEDLELARSRKDYCSHMYGQAKASYDNGYTTIDDMLQAYTNLAEADEDYCNALSDYLLALNIYKGRVNN